MSGKAQNSGCAQTIELGGTDGAGMRSAGRIIHVPKNSAERGSRKRAAQRAGDAEGQGLNHQEKLQELTVCLFALLSLPFKGSVTHAKGNVMIEPHT